MGIKLGLNRDQAIAPTGTVLTIAGTSVPAGYIKCNGAAVSRTVYRTLFGLIGTSYGAGDGSTTFNVPDLRGEFVRGWDDSRGVDAGRTIGSFQDTVTSGHTHTPGAGAGTSGSTNISGLTRPRNIAMMYVIKF